MVNPAIVSWALCCSCVPRCAMFTTAVPPLPAQIVFTDFVESGKEFAEQLRAQGAELVIALTHMRVANDVKLANACASPAGQLDGCCCCCCCCC